MGNVTYTFNVLNQLAHSLFPTLAHLYCSVLLRATARDWRRSSWSHHTGSSGTFVELNKIAIHSQTDIFFESVYQIQDNTIVKNNQWLGSDLQNFARELHDTSRCSIFVCKLWTPISQKSNYPTRCLLKIKWLQRGKKSHTKKNAMPPRMVQAKKIW